MPDPSPSTLTVLNSNLYSSEEGVVAGHSGQFTPGGYLSTVIHTTLAARHWTHNFPMVSPTRYQQGYRSAILATALLLVFVGS